MYIHCIIIKKKKRKMMMMMMKGEEEHTICLAVKRQKALTLKVNPEGVAEHHASHRCGAGMA